MPYLPETDALNEPFLHLSSLAERMGEPPWRAGVIASPGLRAVVLSWLPGYATVPHVHPRAEEIFLVLEGRARFTIGDEPERTVGPGELVLAKRGQWHAIAVPDDVPGLVLFAAVAPNEDAPDEAVE
jgi:quercetin dioxygenase-like cupin family protein